MCGYTQTLTRGLVRGKNPGDARFTLPGLPSCGYELSALKVDPEIEDASTYVLPPLYCAEWSGQRDTISPV